MLDKSKTGRLTFYSEMDEANAIVRRLFERAAERVGSVYALGRLLNLGDYDLKRYLAGEAIPPEEVLLRTVDLVVDDLRIMRGSFSEQAWHSLGFPRLAYE